MNENLYIAVDLGAGSGRVFLAEPAPDKFLLEEVSRFQYPPIQEEGHLRWNFSLIFEEIKNGLRKAATRAADLNRSIFSLGVDSWAVDYGLINSDGNLIANPICYRDHRTDGAMEKVFEKISHETIFEKTGIQFLNFNTLYQVFSEDKVFDKADKLLLLPDLINFFLTGKIVAEYTNATTTQMINTVNGKWDEEIIKKVNLPSHLLAEIVPAGTDLGLLESEIAKDLNLKNVRVIAPATHDTASAVIGAPLEENWAYISSGTWSLVGIERKEVLINAEAARHNFTNEGGAFGTIRFLKNVMGLWIFESCRKEWKARGIETNYEDLLTEIKLIENFQGFIFPDDERFLNPPSMLKAIAGQLAESGQTFNNNPVWVTKVILDSLAFRYASVLHRIENLTRQPLKGVQIVGGGGRNDYLNQMTANACGLMVKAGLTEATVTGNVLVQAISSGRFEHLQEARSYVAEKVELKDFRPRNSLLIQNAGKRYKEIEAFYWAKRVATQ